MNSRKSTCRAGSGARASISSHAASLEPLPLLRLPSPLLSEPGESEGRPHEPGEPVILVPRSTDIASSLQEREIGQVVTGQRLVRRGGCAGSANRGSASRRREAASNQATRSAGRRRRSPTPCSPFRLTRTPTWRRISREISVNWRANSWLTSSSRRHAPLVDLLEAPALLGLQARDRFPSSL